MCHRFRNGNCATKGRTMLINVIHDQNRADRRILLQSEILEHGLEVKFWPALQEPVMVFAGINRAHKQVIRWAKEIKLPMVCIGEDDLHLTAPGAWKYFLDHIPTDFDIYLSGIYCGIIRKDRTVNDFCGLHLYIVHERFYDAFLGVSVELHLDRGLANKGKYIVCDQFCAIQRDGYSDNKKKYASYGHLLEGHKLCCDKI